MIGVPVAERSPSTSRTFDAFARCGAARALSVPPGSSTPADLKVPFSSRTRPFGFAALTSVWCGAAFAVVVDVSGSLRWRRSS